MSGENITVGIVLKADGSGLVGEVRLSAKELSKFGKTAKRTGKDAERGAKGIDKLGDESRQTAAQARRLNAQSKELGRSFGDAQRRSLLLKTALVALATGGMARVIGSFIDAASTSERYATTLKVVLGDVGEANRLFEDMAKLASRVPFEYEQIMGAATQLSGVVRGGVDEVNQLIPIILDIAAANKLTVEETTSNMIRAYSAGIASAELFRDRGITAALDFQAGVSYSAEETMRKIVKSWADGTAKYAGATDALAKTWDGQTSMMADKWFIFRNQVMDAAPFEYLKTSFKIMNEDFDKNASGMKVIAEELGRDVVDMAKSVALGTADIIDIASPAVSSIGGALDIFWQGFKDLPSWMQEVGLVGGLLFGRAGWGAIAAASALNELGNTMDKAYQNAVKDTAMPQWMKDFAKSPTDYMFGNNDKRELKPNEAWLPDISFSGKNGGTSEQSMRELVSSTILEIEARIAADRKARLETPTAILGKSPTKGGDSVSKTASSSIAALEIERDMLYQIAEAREVYGQDSAFMIDVIKAETEARKNGLEVGSDEYSRYLESALAIADLKRETKDATETAKDHLESTRQITSAYDALPQSYKKAEVAARRWHTETLAGLDVTKAGFLDFKNMADRVLSEQLSEAYRDSQANSEEWADGMTRAYLKVEDRAFDLASQSENMFDRLDRSAEDTFINMAKGTLTVADAFTNMADIIVTEMLRITYQQSIAPALMAGLRRLLDFGGGGTGDASLAPQYRNVQVGHTGAIIGAGSASRSVPASIFQGAQRHHRGTKALKSGEVPFIGQEGEGIFTPRQMDNADRLFAAAARSGKTQITIIDNRGTEAPDIEVQQRNQGGIDLIDIIVPAIEKASDGGLLDESNQRNFGQRRQPVAGS